MLLFSPYRQIINGEYISANHKFVTAIKTLLDYKKNQEISAQQSIDNQIDEEVVDDDQPMTQQDPPPTTTKVDASSFGDQHGKNDANIYDKQKDIAQSNDYRENNNNISMDIDHDEYKDYSMIGTAATADNDNNGHHNDDVEDSDYGVPMIQHKIGRWMISVCDEDNQSQKQVMNKNSMEIDGSEDDDDKHNKNGLSKRFRKLGKIDNVIYFMNVNDKDIDEVKKAEEAMHIYGAKDGAQLQHDDDAENETTTTTPYMNHHDKMDKDMAMDENYMMNAYKDNAKNNNCRYPVHYADGSRNRYGESGDQRHQDIDYMHYRRYITNTNHYINYNNLSISNDTMGVIKKLTTEINTRPSVSPSLPPRREREREKKRDRDRDREIVHQRHRDRDRESLTTHHVRHNNGYFGGRGGGSCRGRPDNYMQSGHHGYRSGKWEDCIGSSGSEVADNDNDSGSISLNNPSSSSAAITHQGSTDDATDLMDSNSKSIRICEMEIDQTDSNSWKNMFNLRVKEK